MVAKKWGVLLDLDQTLVLTDAIEPLRRRRLWFKVYNSFDQTAVPPGTARFLSKAGELAKLGVVTTSQRTYAESLLAYHRLQLPVLVAFHDVTQRKPHPEPILKAAARLDLDPAQCIHVGDQLSDIEATIRAGASAIALSWDGALDESSVRRQGAAFCSDWDEVLENISAILRGRGMPA
jgi:HAD superfamily hydrolase (TIGR01549 family)